MASSSTDAGRTFTRKKGDKTLTRIVYNASDEVQAMFDGFTETKPAKKAAGTAASAGTS